MATLGLIGAGNIGSALARLAVNAGIDVVLSNSRGPETLQDLVKELGPRARASTPAGAAEAGDWVVVTIPLRNIDQLPAEQLAGKIVLDTCNYYPQRDGRIPELDSEETTTSELVQRQLPGAKVVKVFNNIYVKHLASLARPSGAPDRTALPIAGDDAEAKRSVVELLDKLGYDAVDAGPLAEGWRFQRDTAAYVLPYAASSDIGGPGSPASADAVRAALAEARRHSERE